MAAALFGAAWLLGVAAAAFTGGDPAAVVAATGLLGCSAFLLRPQISTIAMLPLAVTIMTLGAWRYEATVPDPGEGVGQYNDSGEVALRGVVDGEPIERATSRVYELRVERVGEDGAWREASGRVMLRAPAFSAFRFGDRLVAKGELETPATAPDFDYRAYLLRRGVTSEMSYPEVQLLARDQVRGARGWLADTRRGISGRLGDHLPEPHASLAAGVLVGSRSALPDDLRDQMSSTGTAHMVAVSGQNVAILAGIIIAALAWAIGRRPAAAVALVAVLGYSLLAGGQPSVVRAAIMGTLYIAAIATGRQSSAPIALLLAAAIMTVMDPQVVHEVSFQLSFAATIGLVTLSPALAEQMAPTTAGLPLIGQSAVERPVREMFAVSLAATLATAPITAITFGTVSLIGPVANVFVVPAFVAVGGTAILLVGVSELLPEAAGLVSWAAWLPAEYMVRAIELFAAAPFNSVKVGGAASVWTAVAWYAGLAAAMVWLTRRPVIEPEPMQPKGRPVFAPASALAVVVMGAAVLGWAARSDPDSERLAVTVMDVGQGDAILVEDGAGHRVLVDGGSRARDIREALNRNLPFGDRRIDIVVLSHPQGDHVGGLPEVVDRYDVGTVMTGPGEGQTEAYADWTESLRSAGVPVVEATRGETIELAGGLLEVLAPSTGAVYEALDVNDNSVVLRLTAGDVSFLLTGDLGEDGETALMESGANLNATVLKVGHHGSQSSTTEEFLSRVEPSASVISVGRDNAYGHPSQEVLERLAGKAVLRTDEDGDVRFVTDGFRLWVETGR